MSIVSEKQFLTTEELQNIKDIQSKTQSLILELGEIEMIKIQLENRYELAKSFLNAQCRWLDLSVLCEFLS